LVLKKKPETTDKAKKPEGNAIRKNLTTKEKKSKKLVGVKRSHKAILKNSKKAVKKVNKTSQKQGKLGVLKGKMNKKKWGNSFKEKGLKNN